MLQILIILQIFSLFLTNGQDYQSQFQTQYPTTNFGQQQQNTYGPLTYQQQQQQILQQQSQQQQLQEQQQQNQQQNYDLNRNYPSTQYNQYNPNSQFDQYNQINSDADRFPAQYDQSNRLGSRREYSYGAYGNALDHFDESSFCPDHWIAHNQVCYRFIRSPKRNWYEAKKICLAHKAQLANIDNIDKHAFIMKQLILRDERQNRYYISAKQVSPGNWVNEDNTKLASVDDSFSYEEYSMEIDDLQDNQYLIELNRFKNPTPSRYNVNYRGLNKGNTTQIIDYSKDRVVYGYSKLRDRWMFMPVYDFERNLLICESRELYTADNIHLRDDDKRPVDFGVEVQDFEKIPRGPYFVKQPVDVTYDTAKSGRLNYATLSCLAKGYPTPTYKWFKEEYVNDELKYFSIDPLADDRYTLSGGNLLIHEPKQITHQGVYHCVAENKFGRIRSESAKLNFGYIMEFNLERASEVGDMNWGKALFCDPPQHYPEVKFYWSRDRYLDFVQEDQRVFVSNDGALYFSSIEIVDRANYSCTVQSPLSNTGRNGPFFQLRVHPKSDYQTLIFANTFPKVFPQAPTAGDEIRLECIAFGYPIPSYNWTRKGSPLPRLAHQVSYNRVLVIPNATINDSGEYVCTIENSRKSMNKSIQINIQMRPNFTIPLHDKIKDYNSDVQFECEAFAIPDVNYTWYKNAEKLDIDKVNRDKYIIQDNVLTVRYLDPEKDDGMYQCRAKNQLKAVFSSAQLRVITMKPSFKKRPLESEIYAVYNGNTTIICDPEAAPRPKFQWKKDGNVIGPGGHRRILPNGALIISPTSRDDAGIYTCVATNSMGTDESRARLIVLQELRFINTLQQRMTVQIHQYIYLHCEVTYDEILDVAYIWKHNGEVLREDDDLRIRIINYNTLTIHNVTLLDGGEYECAVKSSVNEVATKTKIYVEGPPGAPGGVTVIEAGKTNALIEWVDGTDNGRPILYYNILGRTNFNQTWKNVSTEVLAHDIDRLTGRKQAEVTHLTPWSHYEFSVCAVNDLGIGPQSAPSPLHRTSEDKPYIAPKNVGGGGGKIGDLTIKWTPLLPQEQNSPGIHYKVFWRLHGKREWATEIIKNQENPGMAVVSIPTGNYYTQYDVKVQAINQVGPGPESEIVTIYSAEDMPQVAPQQPIARGFNSTALNVTWNPVEQTREKIRGRLIGHRLKYWLSGQPEESATYYLSRTTRPWALVVGLQPDTYYLVKVMVYNAAGEGPESERYYERTYRKAPQNPPSSVHFFGVNPSTIRVVWRYVSSAQEEEPVQGYKVRVWEADQDMSTANDTIVPLGDKLEAYITNLTPGKSYKMRVLAFSNGGDGRMSSPTSRFQMGSTLAHGTAAIMKCNQNVLMGILILIYTFKMVIY